jgi:hypothetical protein
LICEVHPWVHKPAPLSVDRHHPVPREWQRHWAPAVAPYPGSFAGEPVWDKRLVSVPSTCHHNVHHWISTIMRGLPASGPISALDVTTETKRLKTRAGRWVAAEIDAAALAPLRYLEVGGDLRDLINCHLWGAI